MKGKTYFFSMFSIVMLTAGLTSSQYAPRWTGEIAVYTLAIVVAIILIIWGLSLLAGPQE